VKVDANQIPFEGLTLEEDVAPSDLDLETDIIKFRGPLKIKANISRVTNVVAARISLNALMLTNCSRCLANLEIGLKKDIKLNYTVNKSAPVIDFDPDIRDEIFLDYPIKPLCNPNCKGLCLKCGMNLNEGKCNC